MSTINSTRRDRLLRKSFGISLSQYEELRHQQNDVCYICQQPERYRENLAVDHCHTNGHVRGLLCSDCNRALGQFKDSVVALSRAIDYLNRTPPVLGPIKPKRPPKAHSTRPRWRCRVETPAGNFDSYQSAAVHYQVHPTTIRDWCLNKRRPGFSMTKVFEGELNDCAD